MCMKKADPGSSVCITNEYGRLRECIIGIGAGMEKGSGIGWSDLLIDGASFSERLETESSVLASALASKGVEMIRPRCLEQCDIADAFGRDALSNGFNQAFPRDNILIVANDLIEFELRPVDRKADILGLYDILQGRSRDPSICWYSTPHCPTMRTPANYPSLDGADFIQLDDRMLIGIHPNGCGGTNLEGFKWMRNTFAFHDVRAVELPKGIRSLGQVMSVPKRGLAVVCREVVRELPSYMRDWDVIDIGAEEAECFACEGLAVDENTYIVGFTDRFDNSHLIDELEKRGLEVIPVDFTAHAELGGSVRSATLPLRRDVPSD